ncbi:CopY/TcrY family copper transport repressor [Vagococcus sp. BWB3-3]|uniref:CopY/TcrY family copper transport repressor n=1 Tax=Vagococcus allomyrinae TaxID=2794353 RepID=A0A940PIC5_9ENTE|nr:CopY/TcrY family copper transport repressor [Vagococcus allomyrinae]
MEKLQVKISDAEWEVMRVVWTLGETTSPEIILILQEKMGWKPPTIKTLIGRLVKKDILSTENFGKKYIYRPLVTEEETVKSATESLFAHICAKKIGATIADLIDEADLTHDDISMIMEELVAKKETAVESIACNCVPGQCECAEH